MDEYGWAVVIFRTLPLIAMTLVAQRAPAVLRLSEAEPDTRLRRLLMVRLLWGATLAIFIGGLGAVGVIDQSISRLVYTMFDATVLIVALAVLTNGRPR